jgi:hypothetical protein
MTASGSAFQSPDWWNHIGVQESFAYDLPLPKWPSVTVPKIEPVYEPPTAPWTAEFSPQVDELHGMETPVEDCWEGSTSDVFNPHVIKNGRLISVNIISEPSLFGPDCKIDVVADTAKFDADMVNHPAHYTSDPSGVECIVITRHRNFNIGNAIKYLWRCGLKDGGNQDKHIEDLKKAIFYINDEIARLGGTP